MGRRQPAVRGKRIPAGALESAHRDHYKSGAHKHRSRNGHRYFKRGRAYPVITHGSALDGLRPCENNDQIWEPERLLRTSPIRYVCGDQSSESPIRVSRRCLPAATFRLDAASRARRSRAFRDRSLQWCRTAQSVAGWASSSSGSSGRRPW